MATMFVGDAAPLSEQGLSDACAVLGVGPAELWTVLRVETSGCGYLPDRRPEILFERHVFHRRTGGSFDAVAPDVSDPSPGGYGAAGAHQYDRLAEAVALDRTAALSSASWGIGQVMGFNTAAVKFSDVEALVAAMMQSEDRQLLAVANFIATNRLDDALRSHDWASFARGYNGPSFADNQYDTKLAAAFALFDAGPLPDLRLRTAQMFLRFCGFNPGAPDGVLGPATRAALRAFRAREGLPDGDDPDDGTLTRLAEVRAAL
jgi:hypothetical protein